MSTRPPPSTSPAPATPATPPAENDPFASNPTGGYRLWTDGSGKYQVEARFVEIIGTKARLQRPDGRYVRIEIQRLCSLDQGLIKLIESLAQNL